MQARRLRYLVSGKKPMDEKRLAQIQRWIDADWESHDIDQDAVRLIQKLLNYIRE